MKKMILLVFIFICAAAQKTYIYSEGQTTGSINELTLDGAVEIALENNSDWKIAQENKANAFLQKRKNQASLFPSLNIGSSYLRRGQENGSPGIVSSGVVSSTRETYSNSLSLSQNIFNRRVYLLVSQAGLSASQTRFIDSKVKHEIVLAVKTAYYNILKLQSKFEFYKESFARDKEQLKYSKDLLEVGKAIKTDVLRSEITLEKTRQNLNTAQNDLKSAKMVLNNLLNIPLASDFQYTARESIDEGIKKILAERFILEEYTSRTLQNNYQLKIKDYDREISDVNIEIARTGYLPAVTGSGSYNWNDSKPELKNMEWRVGMNLTWTVFDAGLTRASIRQAETSKNRIEEERRKIEKEILLNIEKIHNDLDNLRTSLEINKKNLDMASENYDIVKIQYQNGLVSNLNLIDAEVIYTESKINLLDAYYNYKIKLAEWEEAVGEEI
ncbi:MAG: TolC family protein [bacterium]